jgi:hypothetical protein
MLQQFLSPRSDHGESIRALPAKAAIAEKDHGPEDVVTKSPAPEGEPVLAIALRYAFQFLDVV